MSRKILKCLTSFAVLGLADVGSMQAVAAPTSRTSSLMSLSQSDAKAASTIAAAEKLLKLGEIAQAEKSLKGIDSKTKNQLLKVLLSSVRATLSESKGHWGESYYHAANAIEGYKSLVKDGSADSWNGAVRQLFFVALKSSILAGLTLESLQLYNQHKYYLSNDLLSTDEELLLKRLSDELRRVSKEKEAQAVEALIFKNYPFLSQSLRETLVPDTVCRLDGRLGALEDKASFAAELLQKFGSHEDTKGFAFALVGLADAYRQIASPVDSLSGQQKTELLELVEWLQSVREYEPALDITNRLILSQSFEPPFTRDRLISLHARNLNGTHRPVEAAAFYRNLILQYPETDIANTARPKYVLSLHYAQKYMDVAREASTLAGIVRPRDVSWRTFWAQYLSKNYSLALTTSADELRKHRQARFSYWRGRAYEGDGRYADAQKVFKKIPGSQDSALYALFAQSRIGRGPLQPPKSQRAGVSLAARSLNAFDISETQALRRKVTVSGKYDAFYEVLDAGLGHLMLGPMKTAFRKSGDPKLGELLVSAGDAYTVVRHAAYKRRLRGDMPLGLDSKWRSFLNKNSVTMQMLYPLAYSKHIAEAAEEFAISPWLILGIMRAESLFQPKVVSSVGARGLMQIMPATGARIAELTGYPNFEPSHLDRPEVSIAFGAWYLARLLEYYDHQLPLAIAGYNAGPVAIDRWISEKKLMRMDEFLEDIPYEQTRNYVSKVMGYMEIYSRVYSNGARGLRVDPIATLPEPRNNMEMF